MLMVIAALGKTVRYFTVTSARIVVISGIVLGWCLVYGTLLSHYLRF
jgi:hypothetical protein